MVVRSCLDDPTALVVADASVVINLNATGVADLILEALPHRFGVTPEVVLELEVGRRNGRVEANTFDALVASGRVEILHLGEGGMSHFARLVSGGAAETLDDGEAATIACALENSAIAVVDERKANRICADRFATLRTACTVELLARDEVRKALGLAKLKDAIFSALYSGRMRVLADHIDWVVNHIGSERAAQCTSLPRSARPNQI